MLLSAGACVPVKFISKTDGDVGFEYYAPKTYLLVEATKEGKKARLLTLPDVTKRRAVKYQPIWGAAEVGFKVENGVITEFNNKYDAKGPETITALTGAGTALATAGASEGEPGTAALLINELIATVTGSVEEKAFAETNFWQGEPIAKQSYTFPEIEAAIKDLEEEVLPHLKSANVQEPFKSIHWRIEGQRDILVKRKTISYASVDELRKEILATLKEGGAVLATLQFEQTLLKQIADNSKVYPKGAPAAARAVEGLKSAIAKLAKLVKPAAPSIALYELVEHKDTDNGEVEGTILFRQVFLVD